MSFKETATDLVRSALGGKMMFVVLRGLDEFTRDGSDIDVLVPRDRASEALKLVGDMADGKGWAVAGVRDIGYLAQICLVTRWGDGGHHQAIKIDFFNGASWAALGADPLGAALFKHLESNGERETVGLTTLLQKLLYAGYLRDRDRKRVVATCDQDCITAFIEATGIPLTRADLQHGKLGKMARWRLRAASAGVTPVYLPVWAAKVVWRRLVFKAIRSLVPGTVFVISGADAERQVTLVERFRSLSRQSGFPEPVLGPHTTAGSATSGPAIAPWSRAAMRIWWQAVRGETVLVYATSLRQLPEPARASGLFAEAVHIQLPDTTGLGVGDGVPDVGNDLDVFLARLSEHALRRMGTS